MHDEVEWFDFKDSLFKPDEIGEYISALSNSAAMEGEPFGYIIWGIVNDTHDYTNTKFNYQKDVNHEPFQHYLIQLNKVIFVSITSNRYNTQIHGEYLFKQDHRYYS